MTARRWGARYVCASDATFGCERGTGRPARKTCRRCGGRLNVSEGMWGVFVWSGGTGRYPLADALSLHTSAERADTVALAAPSGDQVVRWVDKSDVLAAEIPA